MNTYRKTLRTLQAAVRSTLSPAKVGRAWLEQMEERRLMAATAIKSVDSGGPDAALVEANGVIYTLTSSASGAGQNQIWSTTGGSSTSKLLVDATQTGSSVQSLDDLTVTGDRRIFFSANSTTGGRQLFELETDGSVSQRTTEKTANYSQIIAIDTKLYLYDSTNQKIVSISSDGGGFANVVTGVNVSKLFAAKGQLFYTPSGDGTLWRSDGTSGGTYKISGTLSTGNNDIFVTNDWIYFEGSDDNNTSLYRSDGSNSAPVKIADDFSLNYNQAALVDGAVYFSGQYFNTSPNAGGQQLYKVVETTGAISKASNLVQTNGGAAPAGIGAIGTNVYFVANDGQFVASQGTYDRELWRYDTLTGVTKKITTTETLYPTEVGGGVLSSYYFVAAPTKDDARFGSRRLYRTSPSNDAVEEVGGLPSFTSGDDTKQEVTLLFAGSKGLFFSARNDDASSGGGGRDSDVYFVPTPFSFVDPVTHNLIVEATDSADTLTMRFDDDEVIMNLNGVEERQLLSAFAGDIRVTMKAGEDRFTADNSVTRNLNVSGDSGNDTLTGGAGNDNMLGGSGKNRIFGNKGEDRLRGSNGSDYLEGGDGNDRLYGWAGSDVMLGGNGVDYLYADDTSGSSIQGNDQLNGGSGNDRLYGRGGNDTLVGGKQNDSIFGNDGDDYLQGNDGNDLLDAGAGKDTLFGDAGDDTFNDVTDTQLDALDGGDDNDTLLGKDDDDDVTLIEVVP